jgi:purine-binding chemotaxis protein CheW
MAAALTCLLCQVDASYLALPLAHVIEVCRPLGVTRLPDAPRWVLGACVLRGKAAPVVDARSLLDESAAISSRPAGRWVALRVAERRVVLAVDAVLGARALPPEAGLQVPPLLAASDALSALGTLDSKLLLVLQEARLLAHDALSEAGLHAVGH